MAIICPLYSDPYYFYSIDLSGDAYTLTFRWSNRSQQWLMNIEDADDNMIIRGVPLAPNYPLIRQYSIEKPIGDFLLVPVNNSSDASFSQPLINPREIYKTHFLVYDETLQ